MLAAAHSGGQVSVLQNSVQRIVHRAMLAIADSSAYRISHGVIWIDEPAHEYTTC